MFSLFLAAALASSDYPEPWGQVADMTEQGLARADQRRCRDANCLETMRNYRWLLSEAWRNEHTTEKDRLLMLRAIERNTSADGTDWVGVRMNYFASRQLAMWADGRSIRPIVPKRKRERQVTTATTNCYAYFTRRGRNIYSGCTTTVR